MAGGAGSATDSPTTRSCSRKSPNRLGRKTKTARSLRRRSAKAHDLVSNLRAKLDDEPLADSEDNQAALRFVKTLAGLVRLLEKPDTQRSARSVADGQDHDARQPDRVHARLQPQVWRGDDPPSEASSTSSSTRARRGARPRHRGGQGRQRREAQANPATWATSSTSWTSISSRARPRRTRPSRPIPNSERRHDSSTEHPTGWQRRASKRRCRRRVFVSRRDGTPSTLRTIRFRIR